MAATSPTTGQMLGHFRLVEQIGAGGMGIVFRAYDTRLQRDVAVKVLNPKTLSDPSGRKRFRREALVLSRLNHPNVELVYEFPSDETVDYIVMEFVPGTSLDDRLEQGALPENEVLDLGVQLARGLAAAHARGIIHRDLKPGNLRVTPDHVLKILDFGLSQLFALPDDETVTEPAEDTSHPAIAGTLPYMAPEQVQGRPPDTRSDVYSAGVVLYEMATGSRPFAERGMLLRYAILSSQPPPPRQVKPELSAKLETLILKCLEKNPNARYQSASDLLVELSRVAAEQNVPVKSARQLVPTLRSATRKAWGTMAAVVLLVAIAIGVFVQWRGHGQSSAEAMRWYEMGTAALREGTYVKATRALQKAIDLDRNFAPAHARLADAWNELDFTGKSQHEMLLASDPSANRHLSNIDRDYVEAIRATLTQDFAGAVQDYKTILQALPDNSKPDGYVDLGRAYEKAGDLNGALQSYNQAATLSPDDPAPFVHLGILESRQQQTEPAEAAFEKAESLYRTETNLEGIAEVDYQRGYAASVRGDSAHAKQYFQKSFEIAGEIPTVQLQVRDLTHLATLEYMAEHDQAAVDLAQQAIRLARDNGLDYWAMDGLVRLGNAYLDSDDLTQAEAPLQEALRLAQENQTARVEAAARLSLANIRDQQERPDDSLALAQPALNYYKKFGFAAETAQASNLIVRSELARGEFQTAQQGSAALLDAAMKTRNPAQSLESEELVGRVYLASERYPDALNHFQAALVLSRNLKATVEYQTLHCADALWHLGRYAEAEQMLASLPPSVAARTALAAWKEQILADIRLSQKKYAEAGKLSHHALQAYPAESASTRFDLLIVSIYADTRLSPPDRALEECQQAMAMAKKKSSEDMAARANMAQAVVYLAVHRPQQAQTYADSANRYFAANDLKESELLSFYYLAKAKKDSGDPAAAADLTIKAIAIYSDLGHTLPASSYQTYVKRPDVIQVRQELAKLQLQ